MRRRLPGAFLLGGIAVLGFAPFEFLALPWLSLALLLRWCRGADTPRSAAALGFAWGLGCFLGGVSWVYVSLHDVGGMLAPLAAVATLLFCAYLALYPALAAYALRRWRSDRPWRDALLAGGAWVLTEWLRGWLLTGFPWLALGYSQTAPSPLAGYAPLLGVYGIGGLLAWLSAWLIFAWRRPAPWLAAVAILAAGWGLRQQTWTQPVGDPISVSLLQGNIPQSLKWVPERLPQSMRTYAKLAAEHPARLIILPETAIPLLFDRIPSAFLEELLAHGEILLGSPVRTREDGYTNGAVALRPGQALQTYAKVHLVPFGEFIPPGFDWFFRLVNIPMGEFTAGARGQPPIQLAGLRIMPNICYEDLFGDGILAGLADATLLVNLSNTAWFGDSLAQPQHLQIARMRAMETGRPILRATNTGMTASLAPDGSVAAMLPPFATDALTVTVRGYAGQTPFAHVGDRAALLLAVLACLPALRYRFRRTGHCD